jgi:cell division protein FtsW (lipid II flippase)
MTDADESGSARHEKPLVWPELWLVFATSAVIFVLFITRRLLGVLETPILLVGSLPLAFIVTRSTRALNGSARWIKRKLDERPAANGARP